LAERGGRRFSQAISEGDGISVIVEAAGPDDVRAAEADGAEAIAVRSELAGVREATELPILWCRGGSFDDAARAGADAVMIIAGDHEDDDGEQLARFARQATELGLDWVVSVSDEEELARVLELHDPEIFHLAASVLDRALELLTDVPVGKLAIAQFEVTRDEIVELERRGVDAVIVPARNVAELVGGAPPVV
jgi:indole-3-glycerol phosphate synthase